MSQRKRKGAAVVEAAIIIPFITLLTLGMMECGTRLLVKQKATQATQTGARHAAQRDATPEFVEQKAQEAFWGVVPYTDIPEADREKVQITVIDGERGQPVSVEVFCDFDDFAPFPPFINGDIRAKSVYRKEG